MMFCLFICLALSCIDRQQKGVMMSREGSSSIRSARTFSSNTLTQKSIVTVQNHDSEIMCWANFIHIVVELISDLIEIFEVFLPDVFFTAASLRFSLQWLLMLLLLPICCDPSKQNTITKGITRIIQKLARFIATPLLVIISLYQNTLISQYTKLLDNPRPDNICSSQHDQDSTLASITITLPTLGLCYFSEPVFVSLLGQDAVMSTYASELLTPYALLTWPLITYDAICIYLMNTNKYKILTVIFGLKWVFCTMLAMLLGFDINTNKVTVKKLQTLLLSLGFVSETVLTLGFFLLSPVYATLPTLFG